MKKDLIYLAIIVVLVITIGLNKTRFLNNTFPIDDYAEAGKECIKWSQPKSNGDGTSRFCLKSIETDADFQQACYWSYDCNYYDSWRGDTLGIPKSCYNQDGTLNRTNSYWWEE